MNKKRKRDFAVGYIISPISALSQTDFIHKLAASTKPTLRESSPYFVQKREILENSDVLQFRILETNSRRVWPVYALDHRQGYAKSPMTTDVFDTGGVYRWKSVICF